MSSLKTVQEEIEKALAAGLRTRLITDGQNGEIDLSEFDERDLAKLQKTDAEGELYLRLFIRSRQGDLEKAYKTMKDSLKWRKEYKICDVNEEWFEGDTVKQVLKEGILFYHETDKKKNPILIFQGNKYQYKKDDNKEKVLEKLFAYLLEKQHQQRLGKQIVVICDHQNATLENIDLNFFKFVVHLFDTYYPNILESFLVIDVSWRVSSAWRNIQKWLSPDTSAKFKFIQKAQLTEYVDKSKLLQSLGGQDGYDYEYPYRGEEQHPFEPSASLSGRMVEISSSVDPEMYSPFQDAIEHNDETRESAIFEELPRQRGSATSQSMGGSMGTQLRKRFKDGKSEYRSSIEEITSVNDEELNDELTISPNEEIIFRETGDVNEVQQALKLQNISAHTVIFKIKTNSAANFRVKPSLGAIKPGTSAEVIIMLLLKAEASNEKHHWNKDKFLILFADPQEEITNETNIAELWKTIPKSTVKEYRLNCRVLDVHGLEKRPKTIDDAIEMNFKLQEQISELQSKIHEFTNPLQSIQVQLRQQRLLLFAISGFFVIFLFIIIVLYWFR